MGQTSFTCGAAKGASKEFPPHFMFKNAKFTDNIQLSDTMVRRYLSMKIA